MYHSTFIPQILIVLNDSKHFDANKNIKKIIVQVKDRNPNSTAHILTLFKAC